MATKVKLIPSYAKVLRLDSVDRDPDQPRQTFLEDDAGDLTASIEKNGLHNPMIYVRPNPEISGRYILVAGERRFRALLSLGVEEFEFRVVEEGGLPPYIISLIENKCRIDLNPIDEAEAYEKCMEKENMSVAELSNSIGERPGDIYRSLRLLKLAPEVKQLVREGKLRTGGAHNLVQFKNFSKQIELAQQLIAGEDPPELDERLTHTSERSDTMIIATLPKTADGLIRRLLQFRQRSNPVPFLIKALLDLPEAGQLQGWQHFTKATRENFTTQLRALIVNLQALEKRMATLPETKKAAFGSSAPKPKVVVAEEKNKLAPENTFFEEYLLQTHAPTKPALPQEQPEMSGIKSPPISDNPGSEDKAAEAETPKQAPQQKLPERVEIKSAPAGKPVFQSKIPAGAMLKPALSQRRPEWSSKPEEEPRLKPKRPPTATELEAASKILLSISTEILEGRRKLLSKQSLLRALGDYGSPENVEASTIKALRIIRDYWRVPPDPNHPDVQKFIMFVSKKRHDLGYTAFGDFMKVVGNRDNSPDPVNIQRL